LILKESALKYLSNLALLINGKEKKDKSAKNLFSGKSFFL
jgi:hypothetical protein